MAEEQESQPLKATFPAPPPFYKHFTQQNLARLSEIHDVSHKAEQRGDEKPKSDSTALPPELRFLTPPEPPTEGTYRVFGDHWEVEDKLQPLNSLGIEQLYPTSPSGSSPSLDRAFYLRKLVKSILLSYLELVRTLSLNPEAAIKKIEDLRTMFINVHHLINEYRPHQARETLMLMMEERIERGWSEIERIREMRGKVESVLDGLNSIEEQANGTLDGQEVDFRAESREETVKQKQIRRQKRVWAALEEDLGR